MVFGFDWQDELHLLVLLGVLHWYHGGDNLWKLSFAARTGELGIFLTRLGQAYKESR